MMIFEIFWAFVVVLVVTFTVWILKRHLIEHRVLKNYGIKGPQPNIFFGNELQLKRHRVKVLSQWVKKYGKYFGYYLGGEPVIVISDVDTIRQIFIKESVVFQDRPEGGTCEEPFRSSILYMKGEQWKAVRSCMTPAFSSHKMRLMVPIMRDCVDIFVDIIKKHGENGTTFDMNHVAQGLSLDVIARCALAMRIDCQYKDGGLRKHVREFFENADHIVIDLAHAFPFLRPLFGFLYRMFATGLVIDPILDNLREVIKLRRSGNTPKQLDLLQLLLDTQENSSMLTDTILMANAFIFLAAGFETSSTTIAFITLVLAQKPEVQYNIRAEIEERFPGKTEFTYDDLHELKYMDQVINECMRVHPPVVLFVTRYCTKDTTINGYFFPAGCHVMAPVYQLHHDPELWDAPEEFRPERFAADAERPIHPGQFLPFGLGPRKCIGTRFSQMEIKLALVKLLTSVRLSPGDGFTPEPEIVVPAVIQNPKYGIPVKAEILKP